MNKSEINWVPVKNPIMTRWSKNVNPENPLPEYPRPQMKRDEWLNLNGLWDYAICPKNQDYIDTFDGKILVPFPLESSLSGVKKSLKSTQSLWYHRKFFIPQSWREKKIILHFGAVDWDTKVWINKNQVGTHQGGYTPFSFEISKFLKLDQENEILVKVLDPTDKGSQERGKQSLNPQIIWYTAVSGIWQTVWLEPVSASFVDSFTLDSDIDNNQLNLFLNIHNLKPEFNIRIQIYSDKTEIINFLSDKNTLTLDVPNPQLWSPNNPFLYDLVIKIELEDHIIDEIKSYFGMRKISLIERKDGIFNIALNNKQIFQYGILDQGYWPDGLYAAPTDEALKYDIKVAKELGFNMIRKHVKIEPARWYYHCDRIGILVWQDMPNGGFTDLGDNINNEDQFKFERKEFDKNQYIQELDSMIHTLRNSPSIVAWVPFNEGWGQFDTDLVLERIKRADPSRLVDAASGWNDFGIGDICDRHNYPNPIMPHKNQIKSRAAIIGEFGGLGLEIEHHIWQFKNKFIYRNFQNKEELINKYEKLVIKLKKMIEKGLSAAIYTQLTDVEQEINGLLTYDREIIKMDKERLIEINLRLYN